MIIAGAGTGKTTVITERIKYLISSGKALPQEILALTFTEKSSREMEERVDMALPYGVTQMWISTFHAFCDRILRSEAINIGIDPGYTLMTEAETILFFRKNLFRFTLNYFRPLGNPTKFISGMLQHFSRLKDEDVTPAEYIQWVKSEKQHTENDDCPKYSELASAYRTYEELKTKEGVCDYSDLISHVLKIFRTRPQILARYQKQFKYVLIDEFQDTNYAQNGLAVLLAGKKKNITVVGDDDQAIYRWRGAAISNMMHFRKIFPKVKIIVLTKNYRSTKEILDRSYDLIQKNNPDRLEIAAKIDKKLDSARRVSGERIQLIYTDRVENEAEEVAKSIRYHVSLRPGSGQRGIKEDDRKGYEWKDYAILVRANNHAEPFARALGRAGIPYQFLGPGQLYRQAEVKDLIAYLKVLYNFEDNVAMYRVLSMDFLDILPRDIAVISNYARKSGVSLFESCEKLSKGKSPRPFVADNTEDKISSLVSLIHKHLVFIKK
jgi:DNA helicase-2/ATP-dependent DNA helicase PcrA